MQARIGRFLQRRVNKHPTDNQQRDGDDDRHRYRLAQARAAASRAYFNRFGALVHGHIA